jgi:hypothetical protein
VNPGTTWWSRWIGRIVWQEWPRVPSSEALPRHHVLVDVVMVMVITSRRLSSSYPHDILIDERKRKTDNSSIVDMALSFGVVICCVAMGDNIYVTYIETGRCQTQLFAGEHLPIQRPSRSYIPYVR